MPTQILGHCSRCPRGVKRRDERGLVAALCSRCDRDLKRSAIRNGPGRRKPVGLLIGTICDSRAISNVTVVYALTPETEPEAIAADQRAAIAAIMRRMPRATAEGLSEAVVLPVGVVRRRLKELKSMRLRRKAVS